MTNLQIAEKFARGGVSGKANSMFLEAAGNGNVIYSYGYHFPIALIRGGECFFNTDKYSRTTSKQQSQVRQALNSWWYEDNGMVIHEVDTENLKAMI